MPIWCCDIRETEARNWAALEAFTFCSSKPSRSAVSWEGTYSQSSSSPLNGRGTYCRVVPRSATKASRLSLISTLSGFKSLHEPPLRSAHHCAQHTIKSSNERVSKSVRIKMVGAEAVSTDCTQHGAHTTRTMQCSAVQGKAVQCNARQGGHRPM